MKLFAVTGNPILHSKSPQIYNEWFNQTHYDAYYFRIAADTAYEAIQLYQEIGLSGMNITAPFKNQISNYPDEISESVKIIGGCNTIYTSNNQLLGINTDFFGVVYSLKEKGIAIKNLKCLVLGASGAGAAATFGLHNEGAKVTICNRTLAKSVDLAAKLNCSWIKFEDLQNGILGHTLIVNTLSPEAIIIDAQWITSEKIIFDANYKSSYLSEICRAKNCLFINGEKWLINQAIPAFEIYTGLSPQDINLQLNTKFLSIPKNISLIGFMATGKSSVASFLSKKLNYNRVELDENIENELNTTISEIFRTKGEEYFREMESEILSKELNIKSSVISCGGGVVLSDKNRNLLKSKSLCIWLWASPSTILERVKDNSRPLLNTTDRYQTICNLVEQRKGLYAQSADILINTENKTPKEIAEKIYEEITQTFHS